MVSEINYFKKCSNCNKEIAYGAIYQKCSVSTCKKNAYCCLDCWDIHLPVLNHKNAWAEESKAPEKNFANEASQPSKRSKKRLLIRPKNNILIHQNESQEILIVASKLKAYIKNTSGMNTSANVMGKLSNIVRNLCDQATDRAKLEGRKTLMDKDF